MLNQQKRLKRIEFMQLSVFLGVIAVGLLILLKVENMLLSFLLAFVLKYTLSPFVDFAERRGLKRGLSTLFVLGITFTIIIIIGYITLPFLVSQFKSFQGELPRYIEGTKELIFDIESKISELVNASFDLNFGAKSEDLMIRWTTSLFEDLPNFLSKSLTTLLLAPFFAYFLLKDSNSVFKQILTLVPNSYFELVLSLQYQINQQMGQFIRARLLEAFIVGAIVWLGLWIFGYPFSHLLAVFAALTNLIPYIGPIIGGIPAVIIAFISGYSILGVVLIYGFAQVIDIILIIPLVVAKIVDLHPVTVVVSIIIGAQLMGVLGMVISIPAASMIKVTGENLYHHLITFRS